MVKIMQRPSFDHANRSINSKIFAAPVSLYKSLFLKSFSYDKLPEQLLKLSVLKLDGSSFCISVGKNATVAEIKRAIQEVFEFSPDGEGEILWSLVWAHFCLCYEGQKLTSDKACIRCFGIRDGDQLQFIQHMTIDHKPAIKQPDNQSIETKHSTNYCRLTIEEANGNDQLDIEDQEANLNSYHCKEVEALHVQELELAQVSKGRLSHSKLWVSTRKVFRVPSRFSLQHAIGGPRWSGGINITS